MRPTRLQPNKQQFCHSCMLRAASHAHRMVVRHCCPPECGHHQLQLAITIHIAKHRGLHSAQRGGKGWREARRGASAGVTAPRRCRVCGCWSTAWLAGWSAGQLLCHVRVHINRACQARPVSSLSSHRVDLGLQVRLPHLLALAGEGLCSGGRCNRGQRPHVGNSAAGSCDSRSLPQAAWTAWRVCREQGALSKTTLCPHRMKIPAL